MFPLVSDQIIAQRSPNGVQGVKMEVSCVMLLVTLRAMKVSNTDECGAR